MDKARGVRNRGTIKRVYLNGVALSLCLILGGGSGLYFFGTFFLTLTMAEILFDYVYQP
jgi:hypothetical protein